MTTATYCSSCSEPIEENLEPHNGGGADWAIGRCCYKLPDPWTRGRDGLYTSTGDSDYDEDEEHEDYRPTCGHCGAHRFRVRGTITERVPMLLHVNTVYNAYDDGRIWIDAYDATEDDHGDRVRIEGFEHSRIECDACGSDCSGIEFEYC